MKLSSRISIRFLLVVVFLVAVACWVFGAASSKIEMGDITVLQDRGVVSQFTVTNHGVLPFSYLYIESRNECLFQVLDSDGNFFAGNAKDAIWKRLAPQERIVVKKKWSLLGSRLGISFKDWLGNESIVWHQDIIPENDELIQKVSSEKSPRHETARTAPRAR